MRVFFSLRHPGTLRNFASVVRLLEERGHQVHLSFTMQDRLGDGRLLWEVTKDHPGITAGEVRDKAPGRFWIRMARGARACIDYLRYLTPEYRRTPALKARADEKTPKSFQRLCRLPFVSSAAGRRLLAAALALIERAIPSDPLVEDEIARAQPDVVLVSPLVDFASDQVDVVKSAQALGLRTALCVHSWDNLTNKGLIRVLPDRVFVWNEVQRREAVTMHGVGEAEVVATGAATYDQWFARTPSRTREEFCRQVGLDAARPFFVYLCSSPFIAANEAEFIERWLEEVRSSADPDLARAGILVRPHPENRQPWHRVDLSKYDNVAIWPRGGANPVDAASKDDYFDSLYHSAGAVGVNTSALIEAGIAGKGVFTVRAPEFATTQDGTLHFHYLVNVSGGLLKVASDFDEHRQQLADALRDTAASAESARAFVKDFVRPQGLDRDATPILADAIEALGRLPRPAPRRTPWRLLPLRALLYPLAWAIKVRRDVRRVSRKRERALRPVTAAGVLARLLLAPFGLLLRWRPAKEFARTHILPRIVTRGFDPERPTEEMVAVSRFVQKLARADLPVLVGPWHGGVQAELLYWIPFLRWVRAQHEFATDQIVVISRGGAAPWYEGIGTSYVDLLDFFTPEQLAARGAQGRQPDGTVRAISDFDREVLKLVQVSIGTRRASHLHPMQMFRLFAPFWSHQAPVDLVTSYTSFERLARVEPPPADWRLPKDYVAVHFAFNGAFPDDAENRQFAADLIDRLTSRVEVVRLDTGLSLDGDQGAAPVAGAGVHGIDALVSPRNTLEVQTRVMRGARMFVGSYGGLCHAGPALGVPALAFFSQPEKVSSRHLEAARRGFDRLRPGSLVALDVRDWPVIEPTFGAAAHAATHQESSGA